MPWLPYWLRVAWAAALVVVVLWHTRHAATMPGQPRYWHAGHVLMAAGMAVMYLLPAVNHPRLRTGELGLFALLTLAMATTGVRVRRREGVLNPLWVATTVDMLAMTYMLLPAAARPPGLNWLFVAYLAAQTMGWAAGLWERVPLLTPAPVFATVGAGEATPAAPSPAPRPTLIGGPPGAVGLPAHCTPSVRLTLALMAAAMGYMLAAM